MVIITASGGEGWSGPRIDFCTDCIVVFGARADDYIAGVNTAAPVGHVGKKKKGLRPFPPPLTDFAFLSSPPSISLCDGPVIRVRTTDI